MRRFTRRLNAPAEEEDDSDEVGALPLQRVPSCHRPVSRVASSHRSSRALSTRSSTYRPLSQRYSRPISGVMRPGYTFPSRSPSLMMRRTSGTVAIEDRDDEYSTESEVDAPITMRTVRLDRARGGTVTSNASHLTSEETTTGLPYDAPPPLVSRSINGNQGLPVIRQPLADLIEEISTELDLQPSRDTMASMLTWEMSLDHYFNAFPAPPSPGGAATALFGNSPSTSVNNSAAPSRVASPTNMKAALDPEFQPSASIAASISQLLQETDNKAPQFNLDLFGKPPTQERVIRRQPSGTPSLSVLSYSTCPSVTNLTHQGSGHSPAGSVADDAQYAAHRQRPSIVSSGPSSPRSPRTPSSFARQRSIDRLAQARRKTRVVFGQVIDGMDDEPMINGAPNGNGPMAEQWDSAQIDAMPTPGLTEAPSVYTPSRRGSDKSSFHSYGAGSMQPPLVYPDAPLPKPSMEGYSLNDPEDLYQQQQQQYYPMPDSYGVGLALTTENREQATPSPIQVAEPESRTSMSLFARRKLKKPDIIPAPPTLLNMKPHSTPAAPGRGQSPTGPPPTPPPKHTSPQTSRSGHARGSLSRNNSLARNTGSPVPATPVSSSASSKRKSFFRSTLSSFKRNAAKLSPVPPNSTIHALSRQTSPPIASPTAKTQPMSASATKTTFFSSLRLHSAPSSSNYPSQLYQVPEDDGSVRPQTPTLSSTKKKKKLPSRPATADGSGRRTMSAAARFPSSLAGRSAAPPPESRRLAEVAYMN
jgi:hypothetical protein